MESLSHGMKAPVEFLKVLSPLIVRIEDVPQRVDVGINADCAGILLFTCSKEVFPMFYSCGYGYDMYMNTCKRDNFIIIISSSSILIAVDLLLLFNWSILTITLVVLGL